MEKVTSLEQQQTSTATAAEAGEPPVPSGNKDRRLSDEWGSFLKPSSATIIKWIDLLSQSRAKNRRVIISLTRSQMLQKYHPVAFRSAKDQYMPRLALAMATSIRIMLKSIMLRLPR